MVRLLALAALLIVVPAFADDTEDPQYEMVEYQFALLWTNPDGPDHEGASSATVDDHVAYLGKLSSDGRMLAAGPLLDGDRRVGGAFILDAGSLEEAEKLLAADPAVRAGYLEVDAHPLWAAKGILRQPSSVESFAQHAFLGLLKRPADAPELDDAKLAELQRGHLANMEVMHRAGELVLAGPMGDDTMLRGILIFRTKGRERILELVSHDPSVAANRLEVELYEWRLFEGTLPPRPGR